VDLAADDVKKIDMATVLEHVADGDAFVFAEAALGGLVGGVAHADEQLVADPRLDRGNHFERETGAVLQAAAIGAVEFIGQRRHELVHQMAVTFKLDAIETGFSHTLGGVGIVRDHPGDVPVFHLLREGPVRRFALMAGRQRRQPVALVPVGAAAKMGELDHHGAAMAVAFIGELPHPADDLVLVGQHIVEHRRAVF